MTHQRQGAWRYFDDRLIKINFSIIDNPTLEILISEVKSVHAYRLYLYLLRHVNGRIEYPKDPNSGILIGEQSIMKSLNFSRSTLYRAKGELEKIGVVKRAKKGKQTIVNFACVRPDTRILIHCRSEPNSIVDNFVDNSPPVRVRPDTHKKSPKGNPNAPSAPEQDPKTGQNSACQGRPYRSISEETISIPPSPQRGDSWPIPNLDNVDSHLISALLRIITEQQKIRAAQGIPFTVADVLQDWITDPHMTAFNLTKPRDNLVLKSGKKGTMIEIVGRYFGPKRKRDIVKGIKHLWFLMHDRPFTP